MKHKKRITIKCRNCKHKFRVIPARKLTARCCSFKCSQQWKARTTIAARSAKARGKGRGYIRLNGRYLHIQIAELMIGRKLRPNEVTHHKDENRRHNDPFNIEVHTRKSHMNLHRAKLLAARKRKLGW